MNFSFHTPTKIIFGINSFNEVFKHVKYLGKKCLIVTGKSSMKKFGYIDTLKNQLEMNSFKTTVYDNISNDAKSSEVNFGSELCRKNNINFIIGLGGGSAIDAAKAISVSFDEKNIENFIGKELTGDKRSLPVVAIPTTSGTGSEVTKGAIITDEINNFKSGVRGEQIFPKIALIDPLLSITMPTEVAATTGFDAFTHLFESYIAIKSNILTDTLSLQGLKIIINSLPGSLKNPEDLKLRSLISYAALLGGINVGNASTCLPHRLQQAMGSVPNINQSHAMGLASIYPGWLEEVYDYRFEKIENLKKIINITSKKFDFILNFIDQIKLTNKLSKYGVTKDNINIFIKNISGNVDNDPIQNKDEKLYERIYLQAL